MDFLPEKYIAGAENSDAHLSAWYRQTEETTTPKAYFPYVQMNQQRVRRLLKRDRWTGEELQQINPSDSKMEWLVITEHWCGDAANSIPYMIQLARHIHNLSIAFVYRDQDTDLIDAFLTKGGRSIPKIIAYEPTTRQILGSWGPRPASLQSKVEQWNSDPDLELKERAYRAQKWYIDDRGREIKKALIDFYNQLQ